MVFEMPYSEVERFLRSRYGSRAGSPAPLRGGEWSRAYAFVLDGREVVARFGVHGEDFAKDARMARYSCKALPIRPILELGEAPGGFFAISERAHGDFLDELDEEGMRAILPGLLSALLTARRIDLSSSAGYGRWRPDGSAPHRSWHEALLDVAQDRPAGRIHGWRKALASSPTGTGPFDAGVEALRALVTECPQPRQLIHGDLLYRNVLVQRSTIVAMLDWGNSMYGDGLYDLAWLLYWWPWYPAWRSIDIGGVIAAHLRSTGESMAALEARLRCYQIHIGLDHQAYTAFTGRWDHLARNAQQTMALANGSPPADHEAATCETP